ncbi:cytochrome c oxidase assembly protein subunit 11 [Pseudochelatococcus lubricantis]|uniref:Cytochrome c oxidase assembly protein CtaG n=1 Tax=Pseudochelatococcus lubricantis TaxID=1538102 RepID=A0ABX0UU38_9HYPH|nr:cytochrome c oxidase assembly protein [Pseudochelatococcus lubricantis]NIJ56476.1 cytochrome c oxidase assembly protein subunit 11 [Pseudochelatococcus lubricantis]
MSEQEPQTHRELSVRARRTALVCVGVVAGMLGLAFASVPLYRLFCQVTGFAGTPVAGVKSDGSVSDRRIAVRFDANVSPSIPWRIVPETPVVTVRLGETHTVFYELTNRSDKPVTGVATYNVQPDQVGQYFVKLDCFCFEEQTLGPGETIIAPVVFFIDADLDNERDLKGLDSITLSYTMFPVKDGKPLSSSASINDSAGRKRL